MAAAESQSDPDPEPQPTPPPLLPLPPPPPPPGEFPSDECPEVMPDLSRHYTLGALVLREQPDIYAESRTLRSTGGVGFARCIKTTFDHRGHPKVQPTPRVARCSLPVPLSSALKSRCWRVPAAADGRGGGRRRGLLQHLQAVLRPDHPGQVSAASTSGSSPLHPCPLPAPCGALLSRRRRCQLLNGAATGQALRCLPRRTGRSQPRPCGRLHRPRPGSAVRPKRPGALRPLDQRLPVPAGLLGIRAAGGRAGGGPVTACGCGRYVLPAHDGNDR